MVASIPVIGETFKVDLEIPTNADSHFVVELWSDDYHTSQIPVTSASGEVVAVGSEEVILDLAGYVSIVSGWLAVDIPQSAVASLETTDHARWNLVMEYGDDGVRTRTLSGRARIVNGASQ